MDLRGETSCVAHYSGSRIKRRKVRRHLIVQAAKWEQSPLFRIETINLNDQTTNYNLGLWSLRLPPFQKYVGLHFSAALIVSGVHAMSRRVRDLTQRLEDHNIEHQHRYRCSRKSSTGCGGLRALHSKARTRSAFCIGKSVRYLYVWDCHGAGALLYADGICNMAYLGHNQGVTGTGSLWAVPICCGSIPHISIARLDGPKRVANVPRWDTMLIALRIVLVRFQALGFQGVHLHTIRRSWDISTSLHTSPWYQMMITSD